MTPPGARGAAQGSKLGREGRCSPGGASAPAASSFWRRPARPAARGWDGGSPDLLAVLSARSPSATPYLRRNRHGEPVGAGYNSQLWGRQPLLSNACLQVRSWTFPASRSFRPVPAARTSSCSCRSTYLVLKRRDRRELAWLSNLAIVLAFSGLAYLVAYGREGGQVVLAQAGMMAMFCCSTVVLLVHGRKG